LLENLDADVDDVEIDNNAQEAWRDEIQRRLQQTDTGAVGMIPWDNVKLAFDSAKQSASRKV
jgi:hypothetical protein